MAPTEATLPDEWRGKPMSTYVDQIVPPSDFRNLREYEATYKTLPAGSSYFADIVQRPGAGVVARAVIPSLNTHPKVYSFEHQRLATVMELSQAMGLDMRPGVFCGSRPVSPLVDIFPLMSLHSQLFTLGNGLHAPTMAAWYIYVLSNCVRIEFFYAMTQSVSSHDDIFESVD